MPRKLDGTHYLQAGAYIFSRPVSHHGLRYNAGDVLRTLLQSLLSVLYWAGTMAEKCADHA